MTMLATDWLALSILLCFFAWFAGRWLALALPLAVAVAAGAIYLPTGTPRLTAPPAGKYAVLGARIDVDVAIYVLLDSGHGEPAYYRLPYTTAQANALQAAQDGAENGQGVKADVDGDGGVAYDGPPPVTGEPPKTPEVPAVTLP